MYGKVTVLVVEDQDIVAWTLKRIIGKVIKEGAIMLASNFRDAVDFLSTRRVDLILLDVGVPGGNSVNMISELRSIQKDVRVLVNTGLPEQEYSAAYLAAGANGFLSKRDSLDTIAEAIETVMSDGKYVSVGAIQEAVADSSQETACCPKY